VGLPMGIVYAAAPCMGMLMVLFSILDIIGLSRDKTLGKTDVEVQQSC
jgi:TRAP-type C4-dicarboxylate transport system permease small subunit